MCRENMSRVFSMLSHLVLARMLGIIPILGDVTPRGQKSFSHQLGGGRAAFAISLFSFFGVPSLLAFQCPLR